jgi:hypothetical protein
MNGTIHVPADRVWAYYKRYEGELMKSLHVIADWQECGITVYLTSFNGEPTFQVFADDNVEYEDSARTREECEEVADYIYDTYLTPNVFGALDHSSHAAEDDPDYDLVEDRESEIDNALTEFLEVILDHGELMSNQNATDPADPLFQEIKDHFIEFLACDIGYKMYRPTVCKGTDGEECIVNYPYELYD